MASRSSGVMLDPERGSFVNERGLRLERYTWRASSLMSQSFGVVDKKGKQPAGNGSPAREGDDESDKASMRAARSTATAKPKAKSS